MPNRILLEFQDFLLSRSLFSAKDVPFYAHWVNREALSYFGFEKLDSSTNKSRYLMLNFS